MGGCIRGGKVYRGTKSTTPVPKHGYGIEWQVLQTSPFTALSTYLKQSPCRDPFQCATCYKSIKGLFIGGPYWFPPFLHPVPRSALPAVCLARVTGTYFRLHIHIHTGTAREKRKNLFFLLLLPLPFLFHTKSNRRESPHWQVKYWLSPWVFTCNFRHPFCLPSPRMPLGSFWSLSLRHL